MICTARFCFIPRCWGKKYFASFHATFPFRLSSLTLIAGTIYVHILSPSYLRYATASLRTDTCKKYLVTLAFTPGEFGGDVPFCGVRHVVNCNVVSPNYRRGSHSNLLINFVYGAFGCTAAVSSRQKRISYPHNTCALNIAARIERRLSGKKGALRLLRGKLRSSKTDPNSLPQPYLKQCTSNKGSLAE